MINSPTVLAALNSPSPATGGPWPWIPRRGLKRPRGLWKARRRLDTAHASSTSSLSLTHAHTQQQQRQKTAAAGGGHGGSGGVKSSSISISSGRGSDTDREMNESVEGYEDEGNENEDEGEEDDEDEDEDDVSHGSSSWKRQRCDAGFGLMMMMGGASRSASGGSSSSSKSSKSSSSVERWAVRVDVDVDVDVEDDVDQLVHLHRRRTVDVDVDAAAVPVDLWPAASSCDAGHGRGPGSPGTKNDEDVASPLSVSEPRVALAGPGLISKMITTSIAESANASGRGTTTTTTTTKETCRYEDWEEIKETLARASELCDNRGGGGGGTDADDENDLSAAIPLLRAVIHECHRFLVRFPDPSLFFSSSRPPRLGATGAGTTTAGLGVGRSYRRSERSGSPDSGVTLSERSSWHDHRNRDLPTRRLSSSSSSSPNASRRGSVDRMSTSTSPSPSPSPDSDGDAGQQQQQQQRSRHRNGHRYHHHHRESPTALHAVLGVALFLFGNIIAQDPSLALSREPTTPAPYWLAALDVFDAGENLPCQTSGGNNHHNNADGADDDDSEKVNNNWRVAIVWGRTLVSLAYNATKQQHPRSSPSPSSSPLSATGMTTTARRRSSPSSRVPPSPPPRYSPRSPLAAITALRTAGLAHHGRAAASAPELLTLAADQFSRGIFHMPHTTRMHTPDDTTRCPRAHVLFTLASDVLAVAERLDDAELSRRWAAWADAVFQQMHMEGVDVADDAWRVRVAVARGRCWLVVGSARVEELEDALEREDLRVLMSKKAEDARAGFTMAISFFDRAKASASTESSERWLVDMQPWLSEALLSLANLTTDEDAREALYARTQTEGGEGVKRELGPTPMRRSRSMIAMDVRMDES